MKVYASIEKVEQLDDGTIQVHGIASSEAEDDQGEIVKAEAMRAAIPDYMRFPAVREMHGLSAAGRTLAAEVGSDGFTRIVAHVVDPIAVSKVKNRVYNGFSIGGRVTDREAGSYKVITGLVLNEISLVDRPANPEAVFDVWKRSKDMDGGLATIGEQLSAKAAAREPVQIWACDDPTHKHTRKDDAVRCIAKASREPTATETALAKAQELLAAAEGRIAKAEDGANTQQDAFKAEGGDYGDVKYADPGYQDDKKPRYPIDTEAHIRAAWNYINKPKNAGKYSSDQVGSIKGKIVSAWKAKIDKDGPPSTRKAGNLVLRSDGAWVDRVSKALWDVGLVAEIILRLDSLEDSLRMEAAMEGDESEMPTRISEVKDALCEALRALVDEETEEVMAGSEVEPAEMPGMGMPMAFAMASVLDRDGAKDPLRKFAQDLVAKARSSGDQTLINLAYHAAMAGSQAAPNAATKGHFDAAAGGLEKAGALPADYARSNPDSPLPTSEGGDEHSTVNTAGYPETKTPQVTPPAEEFVPGRNSTVDTSKTVIDLIAEALGKASRGMSHLNLAAIAHDCIGKVTDGMACGDVGKAGARHSSANMGHLKEAHDHLVMAGATCTKEAAAGDPPATLPNPPPGGTVTGDPEDEHQGTKFSASGATQSGGDDMATNEELTKLLAEERVEKGALVKMLGDMGVALERLTNRVEDIAAQPMPALTAGPGASLIPVTKREDGGGAPAGDPRAAAAEFAKTVDGMNMEDRAMLAIHLSRANPFRPR